MTAVRTTAELGKRDRRGTRPDRRQPETPTNIKRYWDPKFGAFACKVLPGEHFVTSDPDDMLVTVLGSCVAACIRDPETGFGGMNHFMLPASETGNWGDMTGAAMRYGNHAMEVLINTILAKGCPRWQLEIKLFGGGNVTDGTQLIGHKNAQFALDYLKNEGFEPAAIDLGGNRPRRIHYFPATGKVNRLLLRRSSDRDIIAEERTYEAKITTKPVAGDIELFD